MDPAGQRQEGVQSRDRFHVWTAPEGPVTSTLYTMAMQERDDLRKWVDQLETQLLGVEQRLESTDSVNSLSAMRAQKDSYIRRVNVLEAEVLRAEITRDNEFEVLREQRNNIQEQLNKLHELTYGQNGYLPQLQNLQVVLELKDIHSPGPSQRVGRVQELEEMLVSVEAARDSYRDMVAIVGKQIQDVEDNMEEMEKENKQLKDEKIGWEKERNTWEAEVNTQMARNAELSLQNRALEDMAHVKQKSPEDVDMGGVATPSDAPVSDLAWKHWAHNLGDHIKTQPKEVKELYSLAYTYLPRVLEEQRYIGVEWVQELIALASNHPDPATVEQTEAFISTSNKEEELTEELHEAQRTIDELREEVEEYGKETKTVTENRNWFRELLANEKRLADAAEKLWKEKLEKECKGADAHAEMLVQETEELQGKLDGAVGKIEDLEKEIMLLKENEVERNKKEVDGEEVRTLKTDLYNTLEECEDLKLKMGRVSKEAGDAKQDFEQRIGSLRNEVKDALAGKLRVEDQLKDLEGQLESCGSELQDLKTATSQSQSTNMPPPPLDTKINATGKKKIPKYPVAKKRKINKDYEEEEISPISTLTELSSPEELVGKMRRDTDESWVVGSEDVSPLEKGAGGVVGGNGGMDEEDRKSKGERRSGRITRNRMPVYKDMERESRRGNSGSGSGGKKRKMPADGDAGGEGQVVVNADADGAGDVGVTELKGKKKKKGAKGGKK